MHASSDGGLLCVGEVRKLCMEGHLEAAVERLEEQRPLPRDMAYCFLQGICKTKTQDLHLLRRLHSLLIHNKLHSIPVLATHLIRLFASCGSLMEAEQVFSNVPKPAPHTWHAIISVNTKLGHGQKALHLYQKMRESNVESNPFLYSAVLKACADIGALLQGRIIHAQIVKSQLEFNLVIANNLVNMYAKCGSLDEANCVFYRMAHRDVVSWGAIIGGYAQHGIACHALELFQKMLQEGIKPDRPIFLNILKWLGIVRDLEQGRKIHCQIIQDGLERDVVVGNALVDMYVKCGNLGAARKAFDKMPRRDVVSWGVIIAGYAQHGHGLLALEIFEEMPHEGIKPDRVIFSSILKACGSIGAIEKGRLIHDQIIKEDLEADMYIGSTLVDMYAKCGCLEEASEVFIKLPNGNVVAWGAIIAGYARCHNYKVAEEYVNTIKRQGMMPNDIILTSILAAYSHMGLVDEGLQYLKSIINYNGKRPSIEHYTCIVDLLGRAGRLNEAEQLLESMPIIPDVIGWMCLLTACRTYGNLDLGKRCFDQVVRLDPTLAAGYVLMSKIYADFYMWEDANRIQELRKNAGAWKKPGTAWIEVDNKLHEFIVGDKSHPQSNEIYFKLKTLSKVMKEEGYMPQLDLVMQKMSNEEKEDALHGHCEKLAIAFGLLNTPRGTTIRIKKNIRICVDCHSGTKIITKIERRDIIITDGYRIHHFKDGACTCGDFY